MVRSLERHFKNNCYLRCYCNLFTIVERITYLKLGLLLTPNFSECTSCKISCITSCKNLHCFLHGLFSFYIVFAVFGTFNVFVPTFEENGYLRSVRFFLFSQISPIEIIIFNKLFLYTIEKIDFLSSTVKKY